MHVTAWACFLTRPSVGIRMAIRIAMMAMTTKSSMRVKPFARLVMSIPFRQTR